MLRLGRKKDWISGSGESQFYRVWGRSKFNFSKSLRRREYREDTVEEREHGSKSLTFESKNLIINSVVKDLHNLRQGHHNQRIALLQQFRKRLTPVC